MSEPASGPVGTAPPAVEARELRRRFGGVTALDGVSLAVVDGEFMSLLGPSGCGKTTLLKIIAGLDGPDEGELRLYGKDALPVPAYRRPVNTVFQSYALFPHLNVRDNVSFGLRMKGLPAREVGSRAAEALELVRIDALADRRPAQLSGGEKQRVALARALVNHPRVLLLDEPLAALDLQLRRQLQGELRLLQRQTRITFLLVTHDQDEALALSDRIAVMREGRIEQLGTGEELYVRPRTRFVAAFLGACNLISGRVRELSDGTARIATGLGDLHVRASGSARLESGAPVVLGIRPENVGCEAVEPSTPNMFTAQIEERSYAGAATHLLVRVGDCRLRVTSVNRVGCGLLAGDTAAIRVHLPAEALMVLED